MLRSGGGLRARERQQPPRPRARQPQAKVVAPAWQHRQRDGALRARRHGRERVPHAVGVVLHRRRHACARVRLQPQLHAQQTLAVRAAADEIARFEHALQLCRAAGAEAPDAAGVLRIERTAAAGKPARVEKNTQAFLKKTGDSERKLKELLKNLQIGRMFILFSGMGKIK